MLGKLGEQERSNRGHDDPADEKNPKRSDERTGSRDESTQASNIGRERRSRFIRGDGLRACDLSPVCFLSLLF